MNSLFLPHGAADGYKFGHPIQYPDGTEIVVSNLTSRSTRRNTSHVVLIGNQYFVKRELIERWNTEFFQKPKAEVVGQFTRYINSYFGPGNNVGFHHIAALHDLGYLPIKIYALPEGTVYPLRVPCLVIYNTHPDFYWLTNFLETILSTNIWGMCTSATTAKIYKDLLTYYAMKTVGNVSFVPYQAHDFSFRGMFGAEAAIMSSFSHICCFVGSDTFPVLKFAEDWYGADCDKELIACSVPATEHSVMCAGKQEGELETFRRLIEDVYPSGIVSIVSDTWDFWHVLNPANGLLVQLKEKIMARNGKVVIRPDTGDPVKIVCGEAKPLKKVTVEAIREAYTQGYKQVCSDGKYFTITMGGMGLGLSEIPKNEVTPETKGAIQCLAETFGTVNTEKGYKLLDEHVGLIYGDSITVQRAEQICEGLEALGFASTNIVFGIGSYTYAYVTRDTDGYAVKATWVRVKGEDREIFKDPKTGDGTKKSATGLVAVYKDEKGEFYYKDRATWEELENCELKLVFENGKLVKEYTLQEIRDEIAKY